MAVPSKALDVGTVDEGALTWIALRRDTQGKDRGRQPARLKEAGLSPACQAVMHGAIHERRVTLHHVRSPSMGCVAPHLAVAFIMPSMEGKLAVTLANRCRLDASGVCPSGAAARVPGRRSCRGARAQVFVSGSSSVGSGRVLRVLDWDRSGRVGGAQMAPGA